MTAPVPGDAERGAVGFDADAFLAAMERPTFKIGGTTYVGRLLSFEEWAAFSEGFQRDALATNPGTATPKDYLAFRSAVRRLADAVFPRPWWAFWRARVSSKLLRAPIQVQVAAVTSFCKSQAAAFLEDTALAGARLVKTSA